MTELLLYALGIVLFALGLLVSIAWHELGHLSTAKLFGDDELARAREAWRSALLERGILPFLRDVLAATAPPPGPRAPETPPTSPTP